MIKKTFDSTNLITVKVILCFITELEIMKFYDTTVPPAEEKQSLQSHSGQKQSSSF